MIDICLNKIQTSERRKYFQLQLKSRECSLITTEAINRYFFYQNFLLNVLKYGKMISDIVSQLKAIVMKCL